MNSTVHTKLHLQYHKHTGKLLHHRHTSYRGLAILFVVAGLSIVGLSAISRATANQLFVVSATVQAKPPTTAAVIATPVEGAKVNGSVMVAGGCPIVTPQAVVALLVDGAQVGSAICDSQNDFTVPVSLSAGSHQLATRVYSITGQAGPDSAPVTISSKATTVTPTITADQPFGYLGATPSADWTGSFSGGTPPYHVHIDWGDGRSQDVSAKAGAQHYSFTYASAVPHNMALTVTDSAGAATLVQYAEAAYATAAPVAAVGGPQELDSRTIIGLYGLFVTIVAASAVAWLEAKHAYGGHNFAS